MTASSKEICRNITKLKARALDSAAEVLLCLPRLSGGRIHLIDVASNAVLKTFSVRHILFCASGSEADSDSIGFTTHVTRRKTDSPALPRTPAAAAKEAAAAAAAQDDAQSALDAPPTPTPEPPTPGRSAPDAFAAHLFVFENEEKRKDAVMHIAQAFGSLTTEHGDPLLYTFEVSIGLGEIDQKGTFANCPFQKVNGTWVGRKKQERKKKERKKT